MAQVLKKTRREVEESLEERSTSIARRLDALESEIPVLPKGIRRLGDRRTLFRIGVGAAAGAVVGLVFMRLRKNPNGSFAEELEHVSESIGREIRKNMNRGYEADESVDRALRKRPPIVQMGEAPRSFLGSFISQISRHVAAALGPLVADKVAAWFRNRSDEE